MHEGKINHLDLLLSDTTLNPHDCILEHVAMWLLIILLLTEALRTFPTGYHHDFIQSTNQGLQEAGSYNINHFQPTKKL